MIYIIRHGKTELNRANVLQGHSDFPLDEEGVRQAEKAADMLRDVDFSYVFSSPLIRAIQTAGIIAPGKDIKTDGRLIEMDYGPYEGADLRNPPAEIQDFFRDFVHNPAPKGMEPLGDVVRRTGEFLEAVKAFSGNILISTHAIAMKGMLEYLTPGSGGSYWAKYIGNCAVCTAENSGGEIGIPHEFPSVWP